MTRLERMQQLRRSGLRLHEIGAEFGVSGNWVGKLLRRGHDPITKIERAIRRPAWTYPSAALLREAHAARDEIRQSWR